MGHERFRLPINMEQYVPPSRVAITRVNEGGGALLSGLCTFARGREGERTAVALKGACLLFSALWPPRRLQLPPPPDKTRFRFCASFAKQTSAAFPRHPHNERECKKLCFRDALLTEALASAGPLCKAAS